MSSYGVSFTPGSLSAAFNESGNPKVAARADIGSNALAANPRPQVLRKWRLPRYWDSGVTIESGNCQDRLFWKCIRIERRNHSFYSINDFRRRTVSPWKGARSLIPDFLVQAQSLSVASVRCFPLLRISRTEAKVFIYFPPRDRRTISWA